MKKLVLVLAVAFTASLYSCGNKANEAAEATDAAVEGVVEAAEAVVPDTIWLNDTTAIVGTDTITVVAAAVAPVEAAE